MRLRNEQTDTLAARAMDQARRDLLLAMRSRGFSVEEIKAAREFIVRDAAGGHLRAESLGLRARFTSAEGRSTETDQYSNGRIRRIVDAAGNEVRFLRDRDGFLLSIERGPEGGTFGFDLSDAWQPLRIQYPDGTSSSAEYTRTQKPVRITNRDGSEIRYAYDFQDRVTTLTDPAGNSIAITYEGLGDSRVISYPNGNRHEYVHDLDSQTLHFAANGIPRATYQYDPAQQSLVVEDPTGGRELFRFRSGRIIEAVNEHATVRLEYDDDGRLLSEETNGRVVKYVRNAVGAIVALVTPAGETISYSRDLDQRLTGITDWNGRRYELTLQPAGPPREIHYPNGVVSALQTNAMGLVSELTVYRSDGQSSELDHLSWQYDTCDRLIVEKRGANTREYGYDRASRLAVIRSSRSHLSEHFELDTRGNRTTSGTGSPCRYDSANQLLREGRREFRYDPLGNLTSDRGGRTRAEYAYNARGQLIAAHTGAGPVEYTYDALGRRLSKRVNGVTTHYEWAGIQLLAETVDDGGTPIRCDYLFCAEFLTPLGFREAGSSYCIHSGRRHEPLLVTDTRGEVVWKADYLSFGRTMAHVDKVRQPLRLPGQYYDEETGLHYAGARYYDPDLGRFLSMDPLRVPGGFFNYYTYCDGDPINHLDPTGEISLTLGAVLGAMAIGVAVGAAIGAGVELYKQRNHEQTDWSQVGYAALVGGCLGGIGAGVGVVVAAAATGALGLIGAGAAGGAAGAAAEYCVYAIGAGEWNWSHFGAAVAAGAAVGAVTAGIGGIVAGRAARRAAQAATREAEDRAAKELADAAAEAERKAAQQALREAAEAADKARFDALARDPVKGVTKQGQREAEGALAAEKAGVIDKGSAQRPGAGEANLDYKATQNGKPVSVDVKTPDSSYPRSLATQAEDIAKKSTLYDSDVKVVVDLKHVNPADRAAFKANVASSGGDMSKISFVND